MLDTLLARLKEALWPGSEAAALPMMDGALKPNRRLEDARPLGDTLPDCDDIARLADGTVLVSAGSRIYRLTGEHLTERSIWCECPGTVGAIVGTGASVYAAIAGIGVVRIDHRELVARLDKVDDQALRCVTALAVLPDGRVAIAEGSSVNGADDWARDLLERRARGRIVVSTANLGSTSTLASNLAWPNGLLVRGEELWFSESWRHRLQSIPLRGGAPSSVLPNLPGYPARMSADPSADIWLSVFAARTQLLEFVLREHIYRDAMLATVDPRYWIAPSLRATGHYLEPLQGGSIKKLGIVKPWAPPRSYGLVLRLSAQGEIIDSLHSRAGGTHHGITSALRVGKSLIVVSKGSGRLLACEPERAR